MVQFLQDNHEQGFSFLEILFVLSIISILLFLSQPLHISILENQHEKNFLKNLLSDVLYIQNMTVTKAEDAKIVFLDDHYRVQVNKNIIHTRSYPSNLSKRKSNLGVISFNEHGTIVQPGTIRLSNDNTTYNIICPLGKGRCYIFENT